MSPRPGGTRAELDRDPGAVARMFDGVAARYDLTNTVLSFAQDVRWRRATRACLAVGPGDVVLDVAAGTGVSTVELARTGATCLATDFSLGMLRTGRSRLVGKLGRSPVPYVAADALHLPLPDASVDAVVISFGLRNTVDVDAALAEFARVTRPGGTLVVCEFSRPDLRAVPPRLHRLPHGGPAPRRPRGELEPRRVRLPRRVDPRLARPARPRRPHRRRRLALGGLAQPLRRHRRPPHGDQARLTAPPVQALRPRLHPVPGKPLRRSRASP